MSENLNPQFGQAASKLTSFLTAFNASANPGDRSVSCSLPPLPSQFSILSSSLPQDKSVVLLVGSDLTDLDPVFCDDNVQQLPVNFLSWQDYEQNLVVSPLTSVHWFSNLLFICTSSHVQIFVTYLLQFHILNKLPFSPQITVLPDLLKIILHCLFYLKFLPL